MVEHQRRAFTRALKKGVRIVLGTDVGGFPWTELNQAKEFEYYVQYGMTSMQAIKSGTSLAAELLGQRDLGVVAPGAYADLVAVAGDPAGGTGGGGEGNREGARGGPRGRGPPAGTGVPPPGDARPPANSSPAPMTSDIPRRWTKRCGSGPATRSSRTCSTWCAASARRSSCPYSPGRRATGTASIRWPAWSRARRSRRCATRAGDR